MYWSRSIVILSAVGIGAFDAAGMGHDGVPSPPVWPEKFHALLIQNRTGNLAVVDLWYDFPGGRNLNIIQSQGGEEDGPLWDNERQNGSTYYYTPATRECNVIDMEVGLLRPDWLSGATYLGEERVGMYSCHKWEDGDVPESREIAIDPDAKFITYWNDKYTGRPVRWTFFDGADFHVIRYDPDLEMDDKEWQVPDYCFTPAGNGRHSSHTVSGHEAYSSPEGWGAGEGSNWKESVS